MKGRAGQKLIVPEGRLSNIRETNDSKNVIQMAGGRSVFVIGEA